MALSDLPGVMKRFYAIAPEFLDYPDFTESIKSHIDFADSFISREFVSPIREEIILYLAAHKVDLALKRKGAGGQVTSLKEGGLSATYATGKVSDEYDYSNYGRAYKELVRQYSITAFTRRA
jgi:hypothetical protein